VNQEGTVKDFHHTYTIKYAVFNTAGAWNSVKAKLCKPRGNCGQQQERLRMLQTKMTLIILKK
jgi:hypothetical protein